MEAHWKKNPVYSFRFLVERDHIYHQPSLRIEIKDLSIYSPFISSHTSLTTQLFYNTLWRRQAPTVNKKDMKKITNVEKPLLTEQL